jgi:hypothetical protein
VTQQTRGATAPTGSELERLLETELRLEGLVRRAREEAAALTASAGEEAARRERAAEAEVEAAIAGLEAGIARETEAAVAAIEAEAARRVAEWNAIQATRVAALADGLAKRVIARAGDGLG